MSEILTDSPPPAVAEFVHRLWELRLEALRRQGRKRGAEEEAEPRRARHDIALSSMAPPALTDAHRTPCGCNS